MADFKLAPEEIKASEEGPKPIYVQLDPEQAAMIDSFAEEDGFNLEAETDRGTSNKLGAARRKYVKLALDMAIEARNG